MEALVLGILRELAPLKDGASPHHTFRDRGKKSITLDLEKPEERKFSKARGYSRCGY